MERNPAVIAQYMVASEVPIKAEVTLKPNEICVVLENGKVVGSVSQQHMEVNPQIGMIGRLFGRQNPQRSFMFVLQDLMKSWSRLRVNQTKAMR